MKKAQILSAIALAFALGVTPVIATVNTVSAYTVADADENIKGSATAQEVANAVAAVKANYPTYNNMLALYDLLNLTGDDAIVTNDDLAATDASTITAELTKDFGMSATDASKITDLKSFKAQIEAAVKAANNVTNYTIIANYLSAAAGDDDAAFRTAVAAINAKFDTKLSVNSNVTISANKSAYDTAIESAVDAWAAATTGKTTYKWANYSTLYNAVNDAQEKLDQYNKDFPRLSNALKADGVLNSDGQGKLAAELAKDNPTVSALNTIATTAGDLNGYNAWVGNATTSVRVAMNAAAGAQDFASEYNYNLVIAIASALQTAVPVLDKTDSEIAQQLVGYKAGETQTTTIYSADGNVSVTGKFEAGKVFVKATKSNKEVKAFDGKKSYIYDIVLTDVNGNEVTPTGEVTVTVKVQGDINGAKSNIYHVDENGKVQLVKSSYKDGVMTFTTSHFSLYAIVEDNGTNLTTPDTGALFGTEGSASTTVAMVAGIATALTAAGAGVVAYRNARRNARK